MTKKDDPHLGLGRRTASMKPAGDGAVVNLSRSSVLTGLSFRAPYVASKAGVVGSIHNAAYEFGPPNFRCNTILPGLSDNARGYALVQRAADLRGQSFIEADQECSRGNSMRCWTHPAEVDDLHVFLASHAARQITGKSILLNGNVECDE